MKKRILSVLFAAALTASLAACGQKAEETEAATEAAKETEAATEAAKETVKIKIGASITPHAEILNYAKDALKEEGIDIEVMEFTDYVLPNTALEEGSIDANYFQHLPYMDQFNVEKGTHLVSAGAVHYEPFGIFAGTKKDLAEVSDGDKIAVPNDTTNEARALLLLEANGLIKLKDGAGLTATKQDIVENPKNLDIVELESAQISRSLSSVAYAVMNGNYAIQAGYAPSDALFVEDEKSVGAQTYGNVIAVKEGRESESWVAKLVEVLHSEDVKNWITEKYDGAVVPLN